MMANAPARRVGQTGGAYATLALLENGVLDDGADEGCVLDIGETLGMVAMHVNMP